MCNKTTNFLQNKKRGLSLKDVLNRVDQDQTRIREGASSNQRNEMLQSILTLKNKQNMVNMAASNLLDEIIGGSMNSPSETFVKELSANRTPRKNNVRNQGNFLEQMRKNHQGVESYYGKGKSHVLRKKMFNTPGFSSQTRYKKSSIHYSNEEKMKIKLKEKMNSPDGNNISPAF